MLRWDGEDCAVRVHGGGVDGGGGGGGGGLGRSRRVNGVVYVACSSDAGGREGGSPIFLASEI